MKWTQSPSFTWRRCFQGRYSYANRYTTPPHVNPAPIARNSTVLPVLIRFCSIASSSAIDKGSSLLLTLMALSRAKGSRGRNAGSPTPPVQIPSVRNYRTGLLPQVRRRNVDSGKGAAPAQWESTSSSVFAYVPRLGFYLSGSVCARRAARHGRFVFGRYPRLLDSRELRNS